MARKLLLLALAAGLCALAADPDLVKLVMPDAAVLVGIQVDQIRVSPLGRILLAQIDTEDSEFRKAVALLGFNPLTDLHEVLIATPATPGAQQVLVVVRGTFDPSRLATLAQMGGGEVSSFQGVDIVTMKQQQQTFTLASLDRSTLVLGDPKSVRGAIARRTTGLRLSPKLVARADALAKLYDLWVISLVPLGQMAKGVQNPQLGGLLKGDAFQGIQEASGGIRLGRDIQFAFEVVTRSEKDATSLADVFKFILGLALTQGKPEQAKLLESLQLNVEGTRVRFGLTIPEAEVAKAIEAQKKAVAAARAKPPAKPAPAEPAAVQTTPQDTGVTIYSSPKDMGVVKLPAPK